MNSAAGRQPGARPVTDYRDCGYPSYDSILPKNAATIGTILVGNGYNTSWFGKNHLIPEAKLAESAL